MFLTIKTYCTIIGEIVDGIEKYFWGIRNGVAMEIGRNLMRIYLVYCVKKVSFKVFKKNFFSGGLDGSPDTKSMTFGFENFGWKRILVDAVFKY